MTLSPSRTKNRIELSLLELYSAMMNCVTRKIGWNIAGSAGVGKSGSAPGTRTPDVFWMHANQRVDGQTIAQRAFLQICLR